MSINPLHSAKPELSGDSTTPVKGVSVSYTQRSDSSLSSRSQEKNCFSRLIETVTEWLTSFWRWITGLCCSAPVLDPATIRQRFGSVVGFPSNTDVEFLMAVNPKN